MYARTSFAILVAVLCAGARAADPLPRAKAESVGMNSKRLGLIATALKADVDKGRLPGAVVAVARKGKLVYYEAVGYRADHEGHHLQHRPDDQADDLGRAADAVGGRQVAHLRSGGQVSAAACQHARRDQPRQSRGNRSRGSPADPA